MIAHEVRKILSESVRREMTDMDSELSEKLAATQSAMAAQGLVHSDAMMQYLTEDASNSLRARAVFILAQFMRHTSNHLNADTLSDFSYLLRETVEAQSRAVQNKLFSFPIFAHPDLSEATRQHKFLVERETHSMVARMTAELRITAAEAQYRLESPYTTKASPLNSPIGAIPRPDDSPLASLPRFNAGTKQQIATALQLYLEELNKPENSQLGRASELRELIRDTRTELDKPDPNPLKINANLRTIAETTRFVGSLNPAYQTLLTFLAFT